MGYLKFENVKVNLDFDKIFREAEERDRLQSIKIIRIYQSTKLTKRKQAEDYKYIIVETEYTNGYKEEVKPWKYNGIIVQGNQEYLVFNSWCDDNKMIRKVLGEYQLCVYNVQPKSTAKVAWIFSIPKYLKEVEIVSMHGERISYKL